MALDFGLLNTNAPAQIAGAYGRGQQEAQANLLAEQQLQHAQNQNALSKYQIDAARMQNESQNALNAKYAGGGFDPMANDTHLKQLYGMGPSGRAQAGEILKYRADQRKEEESAFNIASKRHEIYKQEMGALSSDPDLTKDKVIATFDNLVSNGLMPQTMRDTMVSKLPDDPVALKASALQDAKSTLKGKDLLTVFLPELMVAGSNVINKNPLAPGGAGAVIAPVAATPSPTSKLLQERAALIESGVPPTDSRIQAYDQALAAGESQSMKMQRELQIAIANKAPPAVIAQLQRDIRNLHPGLAMQNVVGVDANGNQIVTRLAGAGGGPQGQFALNQSPTGTARAMLGLSDTDSALLFGPGGPVESGQIPVNKLNASNAKMYVAAIKANPTLNLSSLSEDQVLAASKAKAQGNIQGKQVLTLADRATAKNIAEGNLPPLTGPNSTRIMNEVIAMKPDFKASDYGLQTSAVKAFNQGIQGNKVRSLNVVMDHFNTLEKAADALQSGDVRAINAVSQYIQTQTGKPAPGNFNAVKEILADEIVASVVPGTGALADRVALKKTILAASSPEQLKGIVANYKELIGGQLNGLEKQYSAGTGRTDFKSRYLTPAAVQGLSPSSQYVETKVVNGRTLGKKADGTVEEIK